MNIKNFFKKRINLAILVSLFGIIFSVGQLMAEETITHPQVGANAARLDLYNRSFEIFTRIVNPDGTSSATPVVDERLVADWELHERGGNVGFIRRGHEYVIPCTNAYVAQGRDCVVGQPITINGVIQRRTYIPHEGDWMIRLNPMATGEDTRLDDILFQDLSTNTLILPIRDDQMGIRLSKGANSAPEKHQISNLYSWSLFHTGEVGDIHWEGVHIGNYIEDSMWLLLGDAKVMEAALNEATEAQHANPNFRTCAGDLCLPEEILSKVRNFAQIPFETVLNLGGIEHLDATLPDKEKVNLNSPHMPTDGSGINWRRHYGYFNPTSTETRFAMFSYESYRNQGNIVDDVNWFQVAVPTLLSFRQGDTRLDSLTINDFIFDLRGTNEVTGEGYKARFANADDRPNSSTPANADYAYIVPIEILNSRDELVGIVNAQVKIFPVDQADLISTRTYVCQIGGTSPLFQNQVYRTVGATQVAGYPGYYFRPILDIGQGVLAKGTPTVNYEFVRMGTATDLSNCNIDGRQGQGSDPMYGDVKTVLSHSGRPDIIVVYMVVPRMNDFMVAGQVSGLPPAIAQQRDVYVTLRIDNNGNIIYSEIPLQANGTWAAYRTWPYGTYIDVTPPRIPGWVIVDYPNGQSTGPLNQTMMNLSFTARQLFSVSGHLRGLEEFYICNLFEVDYHINNGPRHTVKVNDKCDFIIENVVDGDRLEVIAPTMNDFVVRGEIFSKVFDAVRQNETFEFIYDYQPGYQPGGELEQGNNVAPDPDDGLGIDEEEEDGTNSRNRTTTTGGRLPQAGTREANQLLLALSTLSFILLVKAKYRRIREY